MKQYLDALAYVMINGDEVDSRAGKVKKAFGYQMRYDLNKGFPAVTTKKLAWKSVVSELLWFLEGSGDERRLAEIHYGDDRENLSDKTTIWTANAQADYWKPYANDEGDLGRIYGVQWRDWRNKDGTSVDQVAQLIEGLKQDPHGRRHIISAWNAGDILSEHKKMALPPCHILAQFFVSKDKLSCQLYQRSCDMFLGVPFNIASYSLLTHIIAAELELGVGEFVHTLGDYHVYADHYGAVSTQLSRKPGKLPTLEFDPKPIDKYTVDDFKLVNYEPQSAIKAEMNV